VRGTGPAGPRHARHLVLVPDGSDPLREHYLAKKLIKDGKPVDYICIKGYVGKSDSVDIVRIYLNLQFNEYVEINKSDIFHAEESDDIEHVGTCIWVRKDAEITRVRVEATKQQAKFMQGEIAQAQLRPTAIAEAARGLRPIPFSINNVECKSIGIGCIPSVLVQCPTKDIIECKSIGIGCIPSVLVQCPTKDIIECTIGIGCIPSVLVQCPTIPPEKTCGFICPTLIRGLCDPSAIDACPTLRGCPSIVNNCASIVNICPVDPTPDDPITQLRSEINKLRAKVKKLEEESA
jgi:hypothetical protein